MVTPNHAKHRLKLAKKIGPGTEPRGRRQKRAIAQRSWNLQQTCKVRQLLICAVSDGLRDGRCPASTWRPANEAATCNNTQTGSFKLS
jgi:hypothetical protein